MYRYKKYKKKKFSPRKKKRNNLVKTKFTWLFISFLMLFFIIFYFVCFSSFFQISDIKIFGNKKISFESLNEIVSKKVTHRLGFFYSQSIFLVSSNSLRETILKTFPVISDVSIKKKYPKVLLVKVKERNPVALFCCQEANCFYADKEGVIFEKTDYKKGDFIIKNNDFFCDSRVISERLAKPEEMNKILKIKKRLFNINILSHSAEIISEQRLNFTTEEGWDIYFNPKESLDWQLDKLKFLLREKIEPEKRKNLSYIDLRFTRVYFKYR